ncbi:hypothetical protein ACFQY4_15805 [Catellatospora bangladeshensis]|uniref:hypothetical protein n=1 Tax=Catellatospora bangladeshensis TaxID=310355 RepID=UPI00338178F6
MQISARVVRTTASFGPGFGTGLSMNPTRPISFITNAFITAPVPALSCGRVPHPDAALQPTESA